MRDPGIEGTQPAMLGGGHKIVSQLAVWHESS
jgi:hypothetical protein